MKTIKVNSIDESKYSKELIDLYISAFPREERMPIDLLKSATLEKKLEVNVYEDENNFIGFTVVINNESNIYLYYLATKDSVRNKGYGHQIIDVIKNKYRGKTIMLCAEHIDGSESSDDIKIRRQKFYKRNGFLETDIIINEFGVRYDLLVTQQKICPNDYLISMGKIVDPEILKKFVTIEKR